MGRTGFDNIQNPGDGVGLKRLGVNLTSEPRFSTRELFQPQA